MLAREVVEEMGERVVFRVEDFGASPLATRFDIEEYPAVFVDDVLLAGPKDFVPWQKSKGGRYVPWSKLENRLRFQEDLRRMVRERLEGESERIDDGATRARPTPTATPQATPPSPGVGSLR